MVLTRNQARKYATQPERPKEHWDTPKKARIRGAVEFNIAQNRLLLNSGVLLILLTAGPGPEAVTSCERAFGALMPQLVITCLSNLIGLAYNCLSPNPRLMSHT